MTLRRLSILFPILSEAEDEQKRSKKLNKKQKVILSLLQEIDEICRRNKIEYYLSPRLTLCAVEGHPFPQNPMFGVVLMKTADMERFRLAVDEDPREKRALESMKSHKWFSGFYLRYTNTDTLCLNLDNTRDYAFPGIGVSIFPLRTPAASVKAERRLSRDEIDRKSMDRALSYQLCR